MVTRVKSKEAYLRAAIVGVPLGAECVEWPFSKTKGYGRLQFQGKVEYAHRAAFYVLHGRWPEVGRHDCNNPACFNPYHVLDGTTADNAMDTARALRHGSMALTAADVDAIRLAVLAGATIYGLAEQYGVHADTVRDAALGARRYHTFLSTTVPPLIKLRRGKLPKAAKETSDRNTYPWL